MSYNPDPLAGPSGTNFIAWLSQRDLSQAVPINFVPQPGIALTPACFAHNVFEKGAAAKCFSNLLAIGFRRIHLDLYWDTTRQQWGFCPVQLGGNDGLPPATEASLPSVDKTSSVSLATTQLTAKDALDATETTLGHNDIVFRADSKTLSIPTVSLSSSAIQTSSPSTTVTLGLSASQTNSNRGTSTTSPQLVSTGEVLVQVGPYSCDGLVDFELFADVLSGHLEETETDLNATMKYVILNIHAAANISDPTGSAFEPDSDSLPTDSHLLTSILSQNLTEFLYTPTELLAQRADLNATGQWFSALLSSEPNEAYFTIDLSSGSLSTPDGWPSEGFVELQRAKRLLTGFGSIDPQMSAYNFDADAATIFPRGYLQSSPKVDLNPDGTISSGCFYQPNVNSVAGANNSWAYFALESTIESSGLQNALHTAGNLTNCGISPYLNTSLEQTTADVNLTPYREYADQSLWAWARGEPRNIVGTDEESYARCAALNITSGRLQVTNCGDFHNGACQSRNEPSSWKISGSAGSYTNINKACKHDTSFSIPHTALEMRHLLGTWTQARENSDVTRDSLLWVDFNDLDTMSCWVVGQNSKCPYLKAESDARRTVVVPTVAAIIVFVLAALTVFVKCAANRRNAHRGRRRAADGWDYEGVPS
ncbi:Hypothetical protein R9X50_00063500 [Acrodontium crateriforme]|uniref:Maintenance of telomere capping protein 6 n=1 Tax=Acrodontium crateriforme TaxID=150365 RepID=A0AAQ3R530_9PEZI|nr:Hypothetical protein R9X50_00063500 [Acrodontium crateriforme]